MEGLGKKEAGRERERQKERKEGRKGSVFGQESPQAKSKLSEWSNH